jgi:uncharacterized membrane protein YhaH (DUF805 family)
VRLFFDSAGRIGRGPFLVAVAVLAALFAAYERLVTGAAHLATGWLVHLVLFFCAVSVVAKRLHDRGRSGWWAALVLLAFAVAWPMRGPLSWIGVAALVWTAVDLGVMPGQKNFNRFGAPLS